MSHSCSLVRDLAQAQTYIPFSSTTKKRTRSMSATSDHPPTLNVNEEVSVFLPPPPPPAAVAAKSSGRNKRGGRKTAVIQDTQIDAGGDGKLANRSFVRFTQTAHMMLQFQLNNLCLQSVPLIRIERVLVEQTRDHLNRMREEARKRKILFPTIQDGYKAITIPIVLRPPPPILAPIVIPMHMPCLNSLCGRRGIFQITSPISRRSFRRMSRCHLKWFLEHYSQEVAVGKV